MVFQTTSSTSSTSIMADHQIGTEVYPWHAASNDYTGDSYQIWISIAHLPHPSTT